MLECPFKRLTADCWPHSEEHQGVQASRWVLRGCSSHTVTVWAPRKFNQVYKCARLNELVSMPDTVYPNIVKHATFLPFIMVTLQKETS